jgi:coenzyme Q-binding protein COQ10
VCAIRIRQGALSLSFFWEGLIIIDCFLGQAVAESATPLFKTLETKWRFHPASSSSCNGHPAPTLSRSQQSIAPASDDVGPTLVSLDLSFAFANPVHAVVSGAFFGRVSGLMVKAFEERCAKVYGPRDERE